MIAGERAALRSWSAGLRAASSEGQVISQSVSQGYNASLVLRCGEELDEATASLVEMAESSGVAVSIRKECFVAGTLIHTREGEKAIEEIREGDEVLSYNPQTQQTEYKPVVQTFTHEARELLNVGIEGESEALGVTATHPFYVRRARDCTSDGDGDDSPSQASRGEWVAAGNIRFTYDNNGNLSSQTQGTQTTSYEYDVRDQLRRVSNGSGTELAAFDYDFSRRRLSKTSAGNTTSFVYNSQNVINEYGAGNTLGNRYDYGSDLIRGELGGEGEKFYFSNALGSVTGLAQVSGGAPTRYEYDGWGNFLNVTSPSSNRVGYTGQRLDEETGLMALGNGERYYAPGLGQFIQQDSVTGSLTNPQSLNRHAYVQGNPLRYTDPSGHTVDDAVDWTKKKVNEGAHWVSEKIDELAEWLSPGMTSREGFVNFKAFVRGAYHGAKNVVLEMPSVAYDLSNRLLGVNAKTRSMTIRASTTSIAMMDKT